MSFSSTLKIVYHMAFKPIRGKDHAERLDSFYAGQAEAYDSFRRRLLHGREELYQSIPVPDGGVWVDLGGGTGSNLECIGENIAKLKKVYIVDLSGSLLEMARKRIESAGWTNVEPVEADATTFLPPEGAADVVTCSYSLTMIPDWFAAIDNAYRMLRPGGRIGVVDFFVSRKYPDEGHIRHRRFTRGFWPFWFYNDNVFLSPDHVPYLHRRFEVETYREGLGKVPLLCGLKAPYYQFVGRKREEGRSQESGVRS